MARLSRRDLLRRSAAVLGFMGTATGLTNCGVTSPAAATPGKARERLEFWHNWSTPPIIKAVSGAANQFNAEHPTLDVATYWGIPTTRALLAVAGGQPPDVVVLYPGGTLSEWANNGALRSMSDLVKAGHYDLSKFVASQIDHAVFNGDLYALPLGMGAYMLYYNKQIFAEAGIPGPPATLQDALAISQKLSKKSTAGYQRIGFIPFAGFAGNGQGFPVYAFLFGGSLWDAKAQQFTIDAAPNAQALQWLTEYYRTYGPTSVDEFTAGFGNQAQDPFFAGKLAMEINGQWEVFNAKNFKPDLDYDVAPIPYDAAHPEFQNATMTRGNSMVIPRGSQHVNAAWQFVTWMQTGEAPVTMAKAVNNMPAVKSYLTNTQLTSIDPRYKRFLAYLLGKNIRPQWPPTPVTATLANEITTDVDNATHASASPQAALDHAQTVMEQELAAAKVR